MMFIVRSAGDRPEMPGIAVKLSRDTPPIVKDGAGKTDFFCVGEAEAIAALRDAGWQVVELRDGYYEDGRGGGVAIWGQGKYWEIRSDPLTVAEAVGPAARSRNAAGRRRACRGPPRDLRRLISPDARPPGGADFQCRLLSMSQGVFPSGSGGMRSNSAIDLPAS